GQLRLGLQHLLLAAAHLVLPELELVRQPVEGPANLQVDGAERFLRLGAEDAQSLLPFPDRIDRLDLGGLSHGRFSKSEFRISKSETNPKSIRIPKPGKIPTGFQLFR